MEEIYEKMIESDDITMDNIKYYNNTTVITSYDIPNPLELLNNIKEVNNLRKIYDTLVKEEIVNGNYTEIEKNVLQSNVFYYYLDSIIKAGIKK